MSPRKHDKIFRKVIKEHKLDLSKYQEFLNIEREKSYWYFFNNYGLEKLEDLATLNMDDFVVLLRWIYK